MLILILGLGLRGCMFVRLFCWGLCEVIVMVLDLLLTVVGGFIVFSFDLHWCFGFGCFVLLAVTLGCFDFCVSGFALLVILLI